MLFRLVSPTAVYSLAVSIEHVFIKDNYNLTSGSRKGFITPPGIYQGRRSGACRNFSGDATAKTCGQTYSRPYRYKSSRYLLDPPTIPKLSFTTRPLNVLVNTDINTGVILIQMSPSTRKVRPSS